MAKAHIVRLVRRIALTLETEIDCGECSHLTPGYVEALLTGQDGIDRWLTVRSHLEQCSICAEEVEGLCQVTKLELDGTWPPTQSLLDRLAQLRA